MKRGKNKEKRDKNNVKKEMNSIKQDYKKKRKILLIVIPTMKPLIYAIP